MTLLPRLKPDPVPPVRTVSEAMATGALKAAYDDTKAVLGVPWMGVVTMAFAQHETFYATLWGGLRPLAGSTAFAGACDDLRTAAKAEAAALHRRPLADELLGMGYTTAEIDEIRGLVEVFSRGNMPYVLIATAARLLLEGHPIGKPGPIGPAAPASPVAGPGEPLVLIEPHHAEASTRAVYADIRETLGLPFVNTDYRALARWPSYFGAAWAGLAPLVRSAPYEPAVTRLHGEALRLLAELPSPKDLTPGALRASLGPVDPSALLDLVRLFQWLLPGLILNVAILRAQLMPR
ncbi:MAG: halocarboxylic acid dehydrogenase DehI family protein [Pseudomonadota bacterium]